MGDESKSDDPIDPYREAMASRGNAGPFPDPEILDAEEFERWLKPEKVWEAYGFDRISGHAALERRIRSGNIRTACRSIDCPVATVDGSVIAPTFWVALPSPISDFWTYGSLDCTILLGRHGLQPAVMLDVRFEPPVFMPKESVKRRQDLPLLPEPLAEAWAKWFATTPSPSLAKAEKSAAEMFPNHNFSRDRARELAAKFLQK